MILKRMLKNEDFQSFIAVAQMCLCIGCLGLLFATTRLLNFFVSGDFWLDFLKGLFTGFSISLFVVALVVNIQGIKKRKLSNQTGGVSNG